MNATFHCFKTSGKWYASERGVLKENVYETFNRATRRLWIIQANGGKYPGLSGVGDEFIFVVIPDDECEFGFPLMLMPT